MSYIEIWDACLASSGTGHGEGGGEAGDGQGGAGGTYVRRGPWWAVCEGTMAAQEGCPRDPGRQEGAARGTRAPRHVT